MSEINLTQHELEVIQGCLLGDGSLSINGKSSCFHYGSSNYDHVKYVWKQLKELVTPRYKDGPIKREIYDNRTKKTYINYSIRTKSNKIFYNLRTKWYPEGIKIVPRDLKLTTTITLLWYIGDGSIAKDSGMIKLCTDSFDRDSLKLLNDQLQEWNSWINFTVNRIYIKRIYAEYFLKYIGECPVESYKHKWNVKKLKNPKLDEYGPSNYQHLETEILKNYSEHEPTINLANNFNIPLPCLKIILKNNNLKYIKIINKSIIQYDNNCEIRWNSLKDAVETTGFNASAIVACCRGRRKTHKEFNWKYEDK
jgi:hypothetical protein